MEREQSYKLQQHANAIDFYSERLGLELENSGQTEPPRSPPVQHLCLTAAAGQGTGCA